MTVRKLLKSLSPVLRRLIDPYSYRIDSFIKGISIGIEAGGRVLDAGAGECGYKEFFKNQHYTAVDLCQGDITWDYSCIDAACNLETLPFKDNTFDTIICTQVLEHVREPAAVLKEFQRVLKPGKKLYLSAPQGWGVHQPPHDYFRFTCYGLSYLLEKAGFQVLFVWPIGGYYQYLANRLTILPKTLFWQIKSRFFRTILFPLELLSYLVFVLILPWMLNALDFLDRRKDYTLNYRASALKPPLAND